MVDAAVEQPFNLAWPGGRLGHVVHEVNDALDPGAAGGERGHAAALGAGVAAVVDQDHVRLGAGHEADQSRPVERRLSVPGDGDAGTPGESLGRRLEVASGVGRRSRFTTSPPIETVKRRVDQVRDRNDRCAGAPTARVL